MVVIGKSEKHSGILMVSENNPEQASIMLREDILTINDSGFQQTEKRVAVIKGKTVELEAFIKANNLKEGSAYPIPVKLIVQEASEPFYPGQEPKINPSTKEEVTFGGAPIYRQTIAVSINSNLVDTKLVSDKATVTTGAATQAVKEFGR